MHSGPCTAGLRHSAPGHNVVTTVGAPAHVGSCHAGSFCAARSYGLVKDRCTAAVPLGVPPGGVVPHTVDYCVTYGLMHALHAL